MESARSLAIFACLPSSSSSSSSSSKVKALTEQTAQYCTPLIPRLMKCSHLMSRMLSQDIIMFHPTVQILGIIHPTPCFLVARMRPQNSVLLCFPKTLLLYEVLLSSLSRSSRLDFLPIQLLRHRTILRPQKFFNLRLIHVVQTPINLSRSGMSVLLRNLL